MRRKGRKEEGRQRDERSREVEKLEQGRRLERKVRSALDNNNSRPNQQEMGEYRAGKSKHLSSYVRTAQPSVAAISVSAVVEIIGFEPRLQRIRTKPYACTHVVVRRRPDDRNVHVYV